MERIHLKPIETRLSYQYRQPLGLPFESAGLEIEILPSKALEVVFHADCKHGLYRTAIEKGLRAGLRDLFPGRRVVGRLIVLRTVEHAIESSELAFVRCACVCIRSTAPLAHTASAPFL